MCFSFALADLPPPPRAVPRCVRCPGSRSPRLPSRAERRPGAGAAHWPCVGRLRRRRLGRRWPSRLALRFLPPHPGRGDRPPAGRAEQSLRVTLPVPRTRLPAETQGGAPELLLRPRVCPARPLLWAGGGHGRACPEGAGGGGREPFGFYQLLGLWRDKGQVASRGEGGPGGRPGLKPVPRWGWAGMQPDLVWSPARP